jgi:hypothetical protein
VLAITGSLSLLGLQGCCWLLLLGAVTTPSKYPDKLTTNTPADAAEKAAMTNPRQTHFRVSLQEANCMQRSS